MFDERHAHRTLASRSANLVGRSNDSRDTRCQTFCVKVGGGLAVDEKAIAAEYHNGLDAGALTNGNRKVANGRHQGSIESRAKLDMASNLVEHIRLNCHELQGIIENRDGTVVPLPLLQVMSPRKFALGVVASAIVLTACGNPQGIIARLPTVQDVYTVFALSGTPASSPSGINTFIRSTVRVDGNANFDVAFDLDATGKVLVYPVQKVVSSISSSRIVGLKKVAGTFATVTSAPTGTYLDSTVVASKGDVIVLQSVRNGANDACQFDISPYIYSKLLIDSIAVSTRTIVVQAVLDPNCGFRSFETGIPTK